MHLDIRTLLRRYRLIFCVLLICSLFAVQTMQTRSAVTLVETPTEVSIVKYPLSSDPTTYEQVKEMVREAVQQVGGLSQVIKPGDSVVIKVNMVEAAFTSGSGVVTNRWVARAVVELAKEAGAGSVVIAEGTAEYDASGAGTRQVTRDAFRNAGYDYNGDMIDDYTLVPLVDLNEVNTVNQVYPNYPATPEPAYNPDKVRPVTVSSGLINRKYWLPKIILDCDVLITVPVLKNHNGGGITAAFKNAIGHAPNDIYHSSNKVVLKENLMHQTYGGWSGNELTAATIVELNLCRKPDFVVVDGLVGIMNGPAGYGQPLKIPNPKRRLIVAGRDPMAVDTVCSLLMGYDYNSIRHLVLARQAGLGTGNPALITVKGSHIASTRYNFDIWGSGVQVRAESVPPVMGSVYPASGAYVSGTVAVGVSSAGDANSGLLKAELYVDGQFVQADTAYPYEFNWNSRSVADGPHDLRVYVYDKMMNETSAATQVNVQNASSLADFRGLPDGANVSLGTITATTSGSAFSDRFYVEQTDRQAGMCILTSTPQAFAEGAVLQISGNMTTLPSGERAVSASTIRLMGVGSRIKPFALNNASLGGAAIGRAAGPEGGRGAYNVGLLVTTWGRVTNDSGEGYFYIDDGIGVQDNSGYKGVRIICGSLTKPVPGSYVSVTGISSLDIVGGRCVRCVRARTQSDIVLRE